MQNIPRKWRPIYSVSVITAPGAYFALTILNDKELLPWLKPEFIPYFGFPLLVILMVSCLFGVKGIIEMMYSLSDKFKMLNEIEKRYKENNNKN